MFMYTKEALPADRVYHWELVPINDAARMACEQPLVAPEKPMKTTLDQQIRAVHDALRQAQRERSRRQDAEIVAAILHDIAALTDALATLRQVRETRKVLRALLSEEA